VNNSLFYHPNPYAKTRLFFFSYAGGGTAVAEPYRQALQQLVDFIPIQLPGRENRILEKPYTDLPTLINSLLLETLPYLDIPFMLWGHCSGALIAFELARAYRKTLGIEPEKLIVSACVAPHLITETLPTPNRHKMTKRELLAHIEKIMENGAPSNPENNVVLNTLLETVRSDFEFYETYNHQADLPFQADILALGGDSDFLVSEVQLNQWRKHTVKDFQCKILPQAHHLFINSHSATTIDTLTKYLNKETGYVR
jgi:medium-chain acyl-[acyl-carrier-protein] hydrolase